MLLSYLKLCLTVVIHEAALISASFSFVKIDWCFKHSYLGSLLVEPLEGVAQNTTFSLKASGFYDDDLPLTYLFYYKKGEGRPSPLGKQFKRT